MGNVTVIPNHVSKPFLPGFATGGSLDAAGNVTRFPFGQNSAGGDSSQHTHVTVGVSVDDQGNLQAYVKDVSTQAVNSFANSPQVSESCREGDQNRALAEAVGNQMAICILEQTSCLPCDGRTQVRRSRSWNVRSSHAQPEASRSARI
jgi:hypothetical protein